MLSDGLTSLQAGGTAREDVEVLDVAQLLLAAVQRPAAQPEASPEAPPVETNAEPEKGDVTRTPNTVTDPRDVGADAAASKEPDPEVEHAESTQSPGQPSEPTGPKVAGGDDDPATTAAEEDQPGSDSEPGVNEPDRT
jgi:hypothetical protein